MKKFIATALLATTMVSGVAFAETNAGDVTGNEALNNTIQSNNNNDNSLHVNDGGTVVNGSNTTVTQDGTQTINSNQAAPVALTNLTTSGHDTCFGSVSGGVSVAGFGVGGGSTVIDENCILIKNAKLLSSLGLKDAAVALLANGNEAIFEAITLTNPELIAHIYDEKRVQNAFR